MNYNDILKFWFEDIPRKSWWIKDPEFDSLLKKKFSSIHKQANAGELYQWRESAHGRLAEIIILDQFSRNIFRNSPDAFASDPLALSLSQTAVATGDDKKLSELERQFLYMPYMHSESKVVHEVAEKLFRELPEHGFEYEIKHKVIIDRFGRYPHRNAILNRQSSDEEITFLSEPGSSF